METINNANEQTVAKQEGVWVDLSLIDTPEYARQGSPEGLDALGADMDKNGQLQNIVLVKKVDGSARQARADYGCAVASAWSWSCILKWRRSI